MFTNLKKKRNYSKPCSAVQTNNVLWPVTDWNGFHLSIESNSRLFGFASLRFVIGWKNSRYFLSQSEVKPKPIVTRSRTFSRASRPLHVLGSSFNWFTGSLCFLCDWPVWWLWFWFNVTQLKTALSAKEVTCSIDCFDIILLWTAGSNKSTYKY